MGETAAVPLFVAMRRHADQAQVIKVYDRIIQDEPRHSSFGWLALAWMDDAWPEARGWLQAQFPSALARMAQQYYCDREYQPALASNELGWGMMSRLEYAHIFADSIIPLYARYLRHYDIDVHAVWDDYVQQHDRTAISGLQSE
ncbi:MAG: hypothetical protein VXW65_09685 [Pseudomonadota bacterium]|nr:hypothetical protein [Pseudomonadota bacterium]